MSDKYLTDHSGILLPGDVILADRGFDIAESVGMMQAKLHIPAFTRGVERVIGSIQQKYSILQSTLPINFVTKRADEDVPLIDRMVHVCCALNNL